MSKIQICLFSSTPDITELNFIVKVLVGTPLELAGRAVAWGYDGFEFLPDPERLPEVEEVEKALTATGAAMPVINSGRMYPQGMALLHQDPSIRKKSSEAYKRLLDFAGHFGARVGLGIARGTGIPAASREQMDRIADQVFRELAAYAEKANTVIMLEPIDPGVTGYINTMDEAMAWVERISSPAFSVMLDTYELVAAEPSVEYGIRAARGSATHIHLYDPGRWPPGVLRGEDQLNWQHIAQVLREEGFRGSGSVVLPPEGDPEPAARKAAAYLRALFSN